MDLIWSEETQVNTRNGLRTLKKAKPNKSFWEAWRYHKEDLKARGYSVTKTDEGEWEVCLWGEAKEEKENFELSKAQDYDIEVPAPEGLSYLPYQKAAIAFAKDKNALIADSMGVGKSIEAIGIVNIKEKLNNILIICPASLRVNWLREFTKWSVHDYTVGVVDRGTFPEDVDVLIINFDIVTRYENALKSKSWDLLIIDEAHSLKSAKAKRTKAILGHGKKIKGIEAKQRIYLTGTPLLNRPSELFTLINSLDPESWPNFFHYARRYCGAYQGRWGWDFSGATNLPELQKKLRETIMIRRTKEEVLKDLPPIRRQVIELPLTPATRALVEKEKDAWEELTGALRSAVESARVSGDMNEYKSAVRGLNASEASAFTEMAKLRQEVALAKLPYALEHIRNVREGEEKIILFAHHHAVIDALKEELGDEAVVLDGRCSIEEKQEAVDRFQTDDVVHYFIGSIQAAGVGLTLTASSTVIFCELDWVPGNMSQAEARVHRIGQHNSVLVQHLVLEGSLDAHMALTLVQKQDIIDATLDEYPELKEISSWGEIEEEEEEEVEEFSPEEKLDLQEKLRILASFDLDHASSLNGVGFNKADSYIGHSLAYAPRLSNRQAKVAKKLVHKYRRQLDG